MSKIEKQCVRRTAELRVRNIIWEINDLKKTLRKIPSSVKLNKQIHDRIEKAIIAFSTKVIYPRSTRNT